MAVNPADDFLMNVAEYALVGFVCELHVLVPLLLLDFVKEKAGSISGIDYLLSVDLLFRSAARLRLAQVRLQNFLGLVDSRNARYSFPQTGQTAVRVVFQFSGLGCRFFHWNLHRSEQNFFGLPRFGWTTGIPQFGQKPVATASRYSCAVVGSNDFTSFLSSFTAEIQLCFDGFHRISAALWLQSPAENRAFSLKNTRKSIKNGEVFHPVFGIVLRYFPLHSAPVFRWEAQHSGMPTRGFCTVFPAFFYVFEGFSPEISCFGGRLRWIPLAAVGVSPAVPDCAENLLEHAGPPGLEFRGN